MHSTSRAAPQTPRRRGRIIWSMLFPVLLLQTSFARLHGQCTTETKYFGPRVGQSDTLTAGEEFAGLTFNFSSVSSYGLIARVALTKIRFKGRTGENTYAFTIEHKETNWEFGTKKENTHSEEMIVWWERSATPVTVGSVKFRLTPNAGSPIITTTELPPEYSGPCK